MDQNICDFTALAGDRIQQALEDEFQYQMNLTDGTYVFWLDKVFLGHQIEPAIDATSQAILQYFADLYCPFSMLRLGRSLSKLNHEHGPIVSDHMSVRYLLSGIEQLENSLHDPKVSMGIKSYLHSLEFRLACELLVSYKKEIDDGTLCPSIKALIDLVVISKLG